MKKRALALFVICVLFTLNTSPAISSRSVSVTSDKTSLFGEEELILSASISGFTDGETIYLKGAFFKEGSTNYFGYTKKDDTWVKNSTTAVNQRQVTIGQWDGLAIVRSDFNDSGYTGKGAYNLKLGYYYITSGGNVSSVNWSSNILSIVLDQPIPTPTESKIAESVVSTIPTITKTTNAPTAAKKTSLKITSSPSKSSVNVTQTPKSNNFAKISNEKQSSKSGALKVKEPSPKKSKEVKVLGAKDNKFPVIMVVGGLLLLISGGSWFGLKIIKEKELYEKIFNK